MNESQNARSQAHNQMHDTATYTPVSRRSSAQGMHNTRTIPSARGAQAQHADARKQTSPRVVVIGGVPFEETKEVKKKKASVLSLSSDAPRVRTIRSQTRTPFPMALMFALLLCTGLFMYMIYNFVEINEQSDELREMQVRLEDLSMHQQGLKVQLENRNDISAIADIAEKDLGMVKMDEVEKSYLDGSEEEKVDVIKVPTEEEDVGVISNLLNALVQNFRDFAEYID